MTTSEPTAEPKMQRQQPEGAKAPVPRLALTPKIKPAAVIVPPISVVVGDATGPMDDKAAMVRKQDLVERIVKASGAKKKDVKLILEASLGVLGDALSAGEELNLPPLGKLKVNRTRQDGAAEVLILKLRRGSGNTGGGFVAVAQGHAVDGEDD